MDLIDREQAIAIVNRFQSPDDTMAKFEIVDLLKDIPSARPKGKWIIKDNPGTGWYRITCSECGDDVTSTAPCIGFFPNAKVNWDFCPNCGADMREVE